MRHHTHAGHNPATLRKKHIHPKQTAKWYKERRFYYGLLALADNYTLEAIGARDGRSRNAVWARLNSYPDDPMSPAEMLEFMREKKLV